jgi:hypothetical protein
MPTPLLKAYAKESGKTLEEAEKCWEKAKEIADNTEFKDKKQDGSYWAFVNSETRKCLGLPKHTEKKGSK